MSRFARNQPADKALALKDSVRDGIDDLALRACRGLIAMTDPVTGLVLDRTKNVPAKERAEHVSSMGSTGFALSLLPEFTRRRLLSAADAENVAMTTLSFVEKNLEHVHGLMRHFVHARTGAAAWDSEFSTLDTSIFLNGCLVVAGAYPKTAALANRLVNRVEWPKLWAARPGGVPLLSYGFAGKSRQLLPATADVRSSENLMPCLLAAGSENGLDRTCWYNMKLTRAAPAGEKDGAKNPAEASYRAALAATVNPSHPLFTSHYGLVWANLNGLHDAENFDLWSNATAAAVLNRAACRRLAEKFKTYAAANGSWWGLSAGDAPGGYVAPGPIDGDPDGTVWPTAALAAVPWAPELFAEDFPTWRASASFKTALGEFGLAPFSIDKPWVGTDVIGIDLGCFAATWANRIDGSIHKFWSAHPVAQAGLRRLQVLPARPPSAPPVAGRSG